MLNTIDSTLQNEIFSYLGIQDLKALVLVDKASKDLVSLLFVERAKKNPMELVYFMLHLKNWEVMRQFASYFKTSFEQHKQPGESLEEFCEKDIVCSPFLKYMLNDNYKNDYYTAVFYLINGLAINSQMENCVDEINNAITKLSEEDEGPSEKKKALKFYYEVWAENINLYKRNHNGVPCIALLKQRQVGFFQSKILLTMQHANVAGQNLTGINFTAMDLYHVNFKDANLTNAQLNNANLSKSNLTNANLTNARLNNANLSNSDLIGATLDRANLEGADLNAANLAGVNFTTCENLHKAKLINAKFIQANLMGLNLSNAELGCADFTAAKLAETVFIGAKLFHANFTSAQLTNTNFTNANLHHANFSNSIFSNVNFTNAELNNANLSNLNLIGTTFDKANLQGANLNGANLNDADLTTCENLHEAKLVGAKLNAADLTNVNLSKVDLAYAQCVEIKLNKTNLAGTRFYSADLTYAVLEGADLSSANFRGANLTCANLRDCIITEETNFVKATLQGADFGNKNLEELKLFEFDNNTDVEELKKQLDSVMGIKFNLDSSRAQVTNNFINACRGLNIESQISLLEMAVEHPLFKRNRNCAEFKGPINAISNAAAGLFGRSAIMFKTHAVELLLAEIKNVKGQIVNNEVILSKTQLNC